MIDIFKIKNISLMKIIMSQTGRTYGAEKQ